MFRRLGWASGDEPGGRKSYQEAQHRRQSRLPDRAPEDRDVGPFQAWRLIAEEAPVQEELVVGRQRELPFDAAAKFLGQEGIDAHQCDRQQQEDADHQPCRQQQLRHDAAIPLAVRCASRRRPGHQSAKRRAAPSSMRRPIRVPTGGTSMRAEFWIRTWIMVPSSSRVRMCRSVPRYTTRSIVTSRSPPDGTRVTRSGRIDRWCRPPASVADGQSSLCPPGSTTRATAPETEATSTSNRFVSPMKSATKRLTGAS